ncbi:hypothetical protein [Henriciella pelagia]|uniref:Type II secretion system protein GspF domain-containing protein n=1 Tax=Henriciella pelagia TaxID=1977912 RepID=A0ABQ1JAN3_9PROT|nr:hypothetical protein [Henriciella pelagia]GGB62288.1 hypothetical protein GCM10011503_08650 [Henriciella pelagia]
MLRAAFLLVSALTTGVTLGRKAIDSAVKRKKQSLIEQAAQDARQRIRGHAEIYLRDSITQFVQSVFIKALLLIAAWFFYRIGLYPHPVFSGIVLVLLALFLVRDAIVFFPTGRLIVVKLHDHGWRPKKAIGETIAARVFEQVLDEAGEIKTGRATHIMLALAGHKMDDLTQDVARKVSEIARETSWHDLRPFMLAAAGKFLTLSALYSAFVFILLRTG